MSDEGKEGKDVDIVAGAVKIINFVINSWTLVSNWWMEIWGKRKEGTMFITSPQNRQSVDGPRVEIRGTHTDPTNAFWLLTHDGDKYWPQRRIRPLPDGLWKESVNVDTKPHDRDASLVLVKTSPFCNMVLEEWVKKGEKTKNWDPITLPKTPGQFEQIQGIVLLVNAGKAT